VRSIPTRFRHCTDNACNSEPAGASFQIVGTLRELPGFARVCCHTCHTGCHTAWPCVAQDLPLTYGLNEISRWWAGLNPLSKEIAGRRVDCNHTPEHDTDIHGLSVAGPCRPKAPESNRTAYFSSVTLIPSAASLRFAPLVMVFKLITTPWSFRSEETPAPLPAVPSAPAAA
jgi:hypothetical protein